MELKFKRIEKGCYEAKAAETEFRVCRSGEYYQGSTWILYINDEFHNDYLDKKFAVGV